MLQWEAISFVAMLVVVAIIVATGLHRKSRVSRIVLVAICVLLIAAVIQSLFFSAVH